MAKKSPIMVDNDIEKHEHVILPNGREVSPIDEKRRASSSSTAKILKHSGDADEAMKAFAGGEIPELTDETNARLLRIIDWHLMPIMCVVYGLNYLDKVWTAYFP
jgi:ACS family allantoate permease-like MFS transporter